MEIIYNGECLWLIRLGETGKKSSKAICLKNNGDKIEIELNITLKGSYIMPPPKKRRNINY